MGTAATAFITSFLTILANGLVVIVIAMDPFKELKSIPNYLILNLAVCDLFVGCSEVSLGLLHFDNSLKLHVAIYTFTHFSITASALTIFALAIERYIVVAKPLQSKEYLTYSHLRLAIVCIWLIAGCVALLSLLNPCHEVKNQLIIINTIGIPTMLFMVVIYLKLFHLVRRSIRRDIDEIIGSEQQSLLRNTDEMAEGIRRREREVALSVSLFAGVFFLCWAPCVVMENVIYIISGGDISSEPAGLRVVVDWVGFLGLVNSLLNPLIYALRFAKFRKAALVILHMRARLYR